MPEDGQEAECDLAQGTLTQQTERCRVKHHHTASSRRHRRLNDTKRGVDYLVVPTSGEEVQRRSLYHANCESETEFSADDTAQLSGHNMSVTKDCMEQRRFTDADYTTTTAAPMQPPARSKLHIEFRVASSHHSDKPSRACLNSPSDSMPSSLKLQVPEMPYEREMTVLIPEWASDSEANKDLADPHEQSPPQSRRRAPSGGTGSEDDHDQRVSA